MSDEDLIRRGDVLAEIELYRSDWSTARDEIAAIPAVQAGVKFECGHPWCGDKCGTEVSTAQPSPDVAALAVLRHAILDALRQPSDMEYCLNLFGLAARTDLPRETLRGIIADMRAEGLVSYHKGLWSEDGTPGGAGYAITDAGRAALARLKGGAA